MPVWILLICLCALLAASLFFFVKSRHLGRWIVPYIHYVKQLGTKNSYPIHVYIAICDHFEPFWGKVSQEIAEHRVATWCREYLRHVKKHSDSQGKHPMHTFFYAEEDYNPNFIESLSKLCKEGVADMELHLHHDRDSAANFRRRLEGFRDVLFHHHGLLRRDASGKITYGFIHGNWALNNSRPDGRWCGVDNELPILKDTGCYADFTFPSAPDITQPPIINRIYFAPNIPGQSRSHERGYAASKNVWSDEDQLLIQGPLALNWRQRRWGIFPRIENGELSNDARLNPERIRLWVRMGAHVDGVENNVFIKLFAHGAIDTSIRYFFGEEGLSELWGYLEHYYNDGERYVLHYVSAWEMYCAIRTLCQGPAVIPRNEHTSP